MKNPIFVILALIALIMLTSITTIKEVNKIDLPEEFPIAKKGDTLVFYVKGKTQYVEFYHKNNSYPKNSKLYIIK